MRRREEEQFHFERVARPLYAVNTEGFIIQARIHTFRYRTSLGTVAEPLALSSAIKPIAAKVRAAVDGVLVAGHDEEGGTAVADTHVVCLWHVGREVGRGTISMGATRRASLFSSAHVSGTHRIRGASLASISWDSAVIRLRWPPFPMHGTTLTRTYAFAAAGQEGQCRDTPPQIPRRYPRKLRLTAHVPRARRRPRAGQQRARAHIPCIGLHLHRARLLLDNTDDPPTHTPRTAQCPRQPARYSTPAASPPASTGGCSPRTPLQTKDPLRDRGTRRAHRVHRTAAHTSQGHTRAHTRPGSLPDAHLIPFHLRVSITALIRAAYAPHTQASPREEESFAPENDAREGGKDDREKEGGEEGTRAGGGKKKRKTGMQGRRKGDNDGAFCIVVRSAAYAPAAPCIDARVEMHERDADTRLRVRTRTPYRHHVPHAHHAPPEAPAPGRARHRRSRRAGGLTQREKHEERTTRKGGRDARAESKEGERGDHQRAAPDSDVHAARTLTRRIDRHTSTWESSSAQEHEQQRQGRQKGVKGARTTSKPDNAHTPRPPRRRRALGEGRGSRWRRDVRVIRQREARKKKEKALRNEGRVEHVPAQDTCGTAAGNKDQGKKHTREAGCSARERSETVGNGTPARVAGGAGRRADGARGAA
ncbi:hypothetical protein DFH09DRAFT_1089929 [Mycena vulgaris]|nr:hypothetical protein DFH09DRAFT_1089929 [Mycena vulgaris]